MTEKNQTKPYRVLSRFRTSGRWVEPSADPVDLTRVQAQGPLSLKLIEPFDDGKKGKKNSIKSEGVSDATNS